ncbi:MAG: 5'-nucleotidase C-terminal domain-containing protein [Burkholderiales bacterium]|jgi:5'-nucleotidase|nr:5'-nucleotidase C-terminal domain-containing protein [Burkholderiales bacterium]
MRRFRVFRVRAIALALSASLSAPSAFGAGVTLLHVGDQESWLISAAGNARDVAGNATSFYGGIDRLAAVIERERAAAGGRSVLTLNAGDAFIPGVRLNASYAAFGGDPVAGTAPSDFYDAIAMRRIGFDAAVFGNHEFDLRTDVAARFAERSGTTYLSSNLAFTGPTAPASFQALAAAGVVAPSKIVEVSGGLRIGLVGATTPLLNAISSPAPLQLIGFDPAATDAQNLNALVPILQAQVDALEAQGVNAIVLMSHLQNANNEIGTIVPQLSGVDIVLSGGGHELMNSGAPRVSGDVPGPLTYPTVVGTAVAGESALVVTSNFGNRYVGELNFSLDPTTGEVVRNAAGAPIVDAGTTLHRVSGAAADADRVTVTTPGTAAADIARDVVAPVRAFVAAQEATIIGNASVLLGPGAEGSDPRGAAGLLPGAFVPGVRNAESNLGNLVADSMRWYTGATVALQNGGGIRASIGEGPITLGNVNSTLSFTNLVGVVPDVSVMQLKALLEHGLSGASPEGAVQGRFPQVSGIQVEYDSTLPGGARVLRIELDDGTLLFEVGGRGVQFDRVDRGDAFVDGAARLSLATIDFLQRGGDGYPFASLGLTEFRLPAATRNYSEVLADFIQADRATGGLGGEVRLADYPVNDVLDYRGRLIDMTYAVPEPSTYAMLLGGLAMIAVGARRRASVRR